MFDQDFASYGDQDQAARQFYFVFENVAEIFADVRPGKGKDKCDDADDEHRLDNGDIQEGKGDADRQRINACGNGEGEQDIQVKGVCRLLDLPLQSAGPVDHFAADKTEYPESQPVVEGADETAGKEPDPPADPGHKSLEKTEKQGNSHCMTKPQFLYDGAAADGDSKGVGCKTDGDEDNLENLHDMLIGQWGAVTLEFAVDGHPAGPWRAKPEAPGGMVSAMHTSCPMEAEKRRSAGEAEQYLCEVTVPNRPRKEQQILFSDRFFRGEG